ncbi:uncharacterized protein LOC127253597 isoform X2 [Andrographis paniculata]|uniref:uncharacterized protein LOC127253597 isoform X2 n=1 Tax=Andrographis paniculata TaxID=175694 RepID=UPI0021E81734|nr:uncharacterized protein LOC127253597 isoform X2 [Andrographis paniculata]
MTQRMFSDAFIPTWYEIPIAKPHLSEGIEENNLDPDEENTKLCDLCKLPIFSTPYVSKEDNEGARILIHKCCNEAPPTLIGHSLHVKKLVLYKHVSNSCENCSRMYYDGFFYQCPEKDCEFILDMRCATTIKVVHRSHRHELIFFRSRTSKFLCGACGFEHEGDFYCCDLCNFYLHHDCALLPNIILHKNHEQHPLCINYDTSMEFLEFKKSHICSICEKELSAINSGIYICTKCNYNIHIKCATSDPTHFHQAGGLTHLPMPNEHTSLIQCFLEGKNDMSDNGISTEKDKKIFKDQNIHSHDLIFHEKFGDGDGEVGSSRSYSCGACTQLISRSFYTCSQCEDFYLHSCCVRLPSQYQFSIMHTSEGCKDKSLILRPNLERGFFFRNWCRGCFRYCNGFFYKCEICEIYLDVCCTLLPKTISYQGHGKSHILFLFYTSSSTIGRACHCCNENIVQQLFYRCCTCSNFEIHALCALFPESVSHKLDRHPVKLSFSKFPSVINEDRDFCEICEKDMDRERWFYGCEECGTYFHMRCLPRVGEYSMIIFGRTIRVEGHNCPLTSIQILTSYNYVCNRCEDIIRGREEDGIAFECTKCSYLLCFDCAKRNRYV